MANTHTGGRPRTNRDIDSPPLISRLFFLFCGGTPNKSNPLFVIVFVSLKWIFSQHCQRARTVLYFRVSNLQSANGECAEGLCALSRRIQSFLLFVPSRVFLSIFIYSNIRAYIYSPSFRCVAVSTAAQLPLEEKKNVSKLASQSSRSIFCESALTETGCRETLALFPPIFSWEERNKNANEVLVCMFI